MHAEKKRMYSQQKVHVPSKYHDRIKAAMSNDRPLSVKVDLTKVGDTTVLMTPGQIVKMQRAISSGKKVMTIRMSKRQVKHNTEFEGGFLSMLMSLARKALPVLLGGIATGALSGAVEKAVSGNGLFLGKRGYGISAKIDFNKEDNGLTLTPVEGDSYDGLYLKHNGQVYQGKGLLLGPKSPFKNIPILGLIL